MTDCRTCGLERARDVEDAFARTYTTCAAHLPDVAERCPPRRGRGPSERRLSEASSLLDRLRGWALDAAYAVPEPSEREMVTAFAGFFETRTSADAGRLAWAVAMLVDRAIGGGR